MSRARTWVVVGSVAFILFEVTSVVLLVPLSLTISLETVYSFVELPTILLISGVAGFIAFLVPAIAVACMDPSAGRWQIINTCLLSAGSIATIFLWVELIVSFTYSDLFDRYPDVFGDGPTFIGLLDVSGPPLLLAWLVSALLRFALSPAWTLPASEPAVEPLETPAR
jgi:hypothetical protein